MVERSESGAEFMVMIGRAVNDGDCSGHPNAVQVTHSVLFDKKDSMLLVLCSLLLGEVV